MANEDILSQVDPDNIHAFEPESVELKRSETWNSVSSLPDCPSPRNLDVAPQFVQSIELSEASELQLWWDKAMCQELEIPLDYRKVGVLLIKWSSKIDDLKDRGKDEVAALRDLFKERFHYETDILSLSIKNGTSPEAHLKEQIHRIMKKYKSPNDLLIVYYSGHGSFNIEEQFLQLHAKANCDLSSCDHPAQLNWNNVEKVLIEEGEGDVLIIMDACFAGNLKVSAQYDLGRAYEVLAACMDDQTTDAPGPRSFTHALHKTLETLCDRGSPFTTSELLSEIQSKRLHNPPNRWSRSANTPRTIRLAPLPKEKPPSDASYFNVDPVKQYLTLRIELKDGTRPKQAQIQQLARNVSRAVRDSSKTTGLRTRRIDCMGLTPRFVRSIRPAAHMISSILHLRRSGMGTHKRPCPLEAAQKPLQDDEKRSRSEEPDVGDGPTAKRRATDSAVMNEPRRAGNKENQENNDGQNGLR